MSLSFRSKPIKTNTQTIEVYISASALHLTNDRVILQPKGDGGFQRTYHDSYSYITDFKGKSVNYTIQNLVEPEVLKLFDDEDKRRFEMFIPMLNNYINSLEVNQKFKYYKAFADEDDGGEDTINYTAFQEALKKEGFESIAIQSDGEYMRYYYEVYRAQKENKLFQYKITLYGFGGFEIKYNYDTKEVVENIFLKALQLSLIHI